ncbi:MAG: PAS domain S-box protein [Methylococcaceae bacterium]
MSIINSNHNLHIPLRDGNVVIDTSPEERFDRFTRIAKHSFNMPIALLCLLDEEQLWLKSYQGLNLEGLVISSKRSSCDAAMRNDAELLYIPNTFVNNCYCDHPCVFDNRPIRFYASAPIMLAKQKIGNLCLIDYQPRILNVDDLAILEDLAHCIKDEFKKIQRKQLTQQFRDQKKYLSAILNTIKDGILTIDEHGIIQTVNKSALSVFGYTTKELLGHNVNLLMPNPFHSAHEAYLSNYLKTQQAKIIGIGREVVGLRKNGETFPMNLTVGEMESNGQRHFVGIARDIAEQRKMQLALEEFKYVLDHTVDCVFMCRTDTLRFTYSNEGMRQQVGYSAEELLILEIMVISPEFDRERYQQLINSLQSDEKLSLTLETIHRHKEGHDIPVEVTFQVLKQTENRPRLLAIVRDISERKAVERMKNQFVSTVSHELRTPLTSIRGALGLVLGGALGQIPEKALPMLTMANRNSERLTLLINDLLDLEKIESENMAFTFATVDLAQIVRQALEANQGYSDGYRVRLHLHPFAEQAWVHADENRLMQVLSNLLSNAIKFSHQGGRVDISISCQEESYQVAIQDYGAGIPESFRSRIFGRFAQADSSDNRQKGGSGLGLSITKVIIERHQGTIGFDSTEGAGTTFFFSLPKLVLTKAVEPSPLTTHCLLLCQDNADMNCALVEQLRQENFLYDVSHSVAQAKVLLNAKKYALMVLDLSLPEADCLTFIHELRSLPNTEELNIIITSFSQVDAPPPASLNTDALQRLVVTRDQLHHALRLALHNNQRAKVLHVEDDLDIIQLVQGIFSESNIDCHAVRTLAQARAFFNRYTVDLVILDLSLPDGSGMELLNNIGDHCQVVVFSGHDISDAFNQQVAAVLVKSTTDNEQLLATIRRVLNANQTMKIQPYDAIK